MWKRSVESERRPQGWHANGGMSWSLSVALYLRDVYGLPATKPFFVPPLSPEVPQQIPVTGPAGDNTLADEWAYWFEALVNSRASISEVAGLLLEERSPTFRQAVEKWLPQAIETAENARQIEMEELWIGRGKAGVTLPKLVRSIEKELGHKAAPFTLEFRILPVAGQWLHQVAPNHVLMSLDVQSNPGSMRRLLGPIVRELAH
ncbi:hypothetical protein ACX80D_01690 [Arthrobacter sp. Sr24]